MMTTTRLLPFFLVPALWVTDPDSASGKEMPTGHHGGMITQCTDPQFTWESPASESKVGSLDTIAFTASDNTEPSSLQAWVNLQPVKLTITPQRSGMLAVEGKLASPVTQGRAWIKVTGTSQDGCDQIFTWNVYAGQP